eukprot:Gregarina_sp_Pseudo_9__1427@NODE_1955_length_1235_cov_6_767559_g1812_i0_p2_GENE_NODE_1955_length_1235_cov_6_767559_g1812_i0NODE_1955_length_1235_cov_6_767559_g1812_i0_p2_ORF_typecomplete_len262_score78_27zfMYND/PF01753_18/2_2e11zfC6H2/PF15801_5/0_025Ecl1/PF12855_7/0_022zfMss51/PF13824_6/0_21Meleagrin/PF08189_11/1_5_NODE_1955_length_1235_cov_6_767559_g1812_i0200985
MTRELAACSGCNRKEGENGVRIKRCAKCQTTPYCSRECQKADWKRHKKVCNKNASTRAATMGLSVSVAKPFTRLQSNVWLHDRPSCDTYKLLIDSYRLRMDDEYKFEEHAAEDSLYGDAVSGLQGFQRFLSLAEKCTGLLPPWWNEEAHSECVDVGLREGWSSLQTKITKQDVIEQYSDNLIPMQLRMLSEQVYGRGLKGESGAPMLAYMVANENGEGYHSLFDASTLFDRGRLSSQMGQTNNQPAYVPKARGTFTASNNT